MKMETFTTTMNDYIIKQFIKSSWVSNERIIKLSDVLKRPSAAHTLIFKFNGEVFSGRVTNLRKRNRDIYMDAELEGLCLASSIDSYGDVWAFIEDSEWEIN